MKRGVLRLVLVPILSLLVFPVRSLRAERITWDFPQIVGDAQSLIPKLSVDAAGRQHILYIRDAQYIYANRKSSIDTWKTVTLLPVWNDTAHPGDMLVTDQPGCEADVGVALFSTRQGGQGVFYLHLSSPGWSSAVTAAQSAHLSNLALTTSPSGRERICYESYQSETGSDLWCATSGGESWELQLVDGESPEIQGVGLNLSAKRNPVTGEVGLFYYGNYPFGDPMGAGFDHLAFPLRFTKQGAQTVRSMVESHLADCAPDGYSCAQFLPASAVPSAVADAQGRVQILFLDPRTGAFRLASQTSPGGFRFARSDVDADNAPGQGGAAWPSSASLAMGSDGILRAVIVNVSGIDKGIRYGERVDRVWRFEPVPVPMGPYTLDGYVSLALDGDNNPHIAYSEMRFDENRSLVGYIRGWRAKEESAARAEPIQPRGTPAEKLEKLIAVFTDLLGIRTDSAK